MSVDDEIAERINLELFHRGWTQEDLVDRLRGTSIHKASVARILTPKVGTARRKITVAELCSFSAVLDISPDELLRESAYVTYRYRRERVCALVEELALITRRQGPSIEVLESEVA